MQEAKAEKEKASRPKALTTPYDMTDIFVKVRFNKDADWKRFPRCSSIAQARRITEFYLNFEYVITVDGQTVEYRKARKGFPGRIDQAGHPTLGRKKP